MPKDVVVPDWLRSLIDEVLQSGEDWPKGKYPALAIKVREILDEDWLDGQASLLQLLIDEVERLQANLDLLSKPFADPAFAKALVEWAGEESLKQSTAEVERLRAAH